MIKINKSLGFTLIEFIIVMVILAIIAVIASKPVSQGYLAYVTGKKIIIADWQVRYALERMRRDMQSMVSIVYTGSNSPGVSSITFIDAYNDTITYQLSGTTLTRTDANGLNIPQVLADGISSLVFSYYDANGAAVSVPASAASTLTISSVTINISITLNGVVFPITTSVFTRNT